MLLSLVDFLRCPAHAEEGPLVLSVETWAGPRVAEGILGCPVCHARYPIHEGSVHFRQVVLDVRQSAEQPLVDATRVAAQLGLNEPGGIVLLTGRYSHVHQALIDFADVVCLLVDAPRTSSNQAVNFELSDRLPLMDHVLRGAAITESRGSPAFLAEVARCVRGGGRVVGPAIVPPDPGIRFVASDTIEWVGEVFKPSLTTPLRRAERVSEM